MAEYVVTVMTTVTETYYVEASSLEEAGETWSDFPRAMSECVGIEGVSVAEPEDDD